MSKLLMLAFMIASIHAYAKDLPKELHTLNGDYVLTSGDERCDENISIWAYENLSVNLEKNRDVYFTEINNGRSSGRCADGIGSKDVYNTTFKNKTLTSFVTEDRVGCFTPKSVAKLVKQAELIILDNESFVLTTLMLSDRPIQCRYKSSMSK